MEKERRVVTKREARREKGERNRKQRPDRREEKQKKRGNKAETEGRFSGPKLEKHHHPALVPNDCSSLSTVAFGHHHPAPPFRH